MKNKNIFKDRFANDVAASEEMTAFMEEYFFPAYNEQFGRKAARADDQEDIISGVNWYCTMKDGTEALLNQKAALTYLNRPAPLSTFAFELGYVNEEGRFTEGWLTRAQKDTEGYILVWPHGARDDNGNIKLDVIEVMLVKRNKVIELLERSYGLTEYALRKEAIRVVESQDHEEYRLDRRKRFERVVRSTWPDEREKSVTFKHSVQMPEQTLNILIDKSDLSRLAEEVYWYKIGHPIKRIRHKNYRSPWSWEKVNEYMR